MPVNVQAVDEALEVLNRIHRADGTVMPALLALRVPCNDAVGDDPTVQVKVEDGQCYVGILGVINGLFGVDDRGSGWLSAWYADKDNPASLLQFGWLGERPPSVSPVHDAMVAAGWTKNMIGAAMDAAALHRPADETEVDQSEGIVDRGTFC